MEVTKNIFLIERGISGTSVQFFSCRFRGCYSHKEDYVLIINYGSFNSYPLCDVT